MTSLFFFGCHYFNFDWLIDWFDWLVFEWSIPFWFVDSDSSMNQSIINSQWSISPIPSTSIRKWYDTIIIVELIAFIFIIPDDCHSWMANVCGHCSILCTVMVYTMPVCNTLRWVRCSGIIAVVYNNITHFVQNSFLRLSVSEWDSAASCFEYLFAWPMCSDRKRRAGHVWRPNKRRAGRSYHNRKDGIMCDRDRSFSSDVTGNGQSRWRDGKWRLNPGTQRRNIPVSLKSVLKYVGKLPL